MRSAFEISKLCFLLVILSIAILKYTGSELVDAQYADQYIQFLLPAFFLFGGVMVGWIITLFFTQELDPPRHLLVKGFFVGLAIGIVAVFLYLLRMGGAT